MVIKIKPAPTRIKPKPVAAKSKPKAKTEAKKPVKTTTKTLAETVETSKLAEPLKKAFKVLAQTVSPQGSPGWTDLPRLAEDVAPFATAAAKNNIVVESGRVRDEIKAAKKNLAKSSAEMMAELGVKVMYIRRPVSQQSLAAMLGEPYLEQTGGITLAYRVREKGGNVVDVSTAICSNSDVFERVVGRHEAVANFNEGHYIQLKLPRGTNVEHQLHRRFGFR